MKPKVVTRVLGMVYVVHIWYIYMVYEMKVSEDKGSEYRMAYTRIVQNGCRQEVQKE